MEKKTHWISLLRNRLKNTGDSEPEQALLRLAIAGILLLYFCVPWSSDEHWADIFNSLPNIIIITATSFAFIIFAAIINKPQPSPARRVAGIVLDMVSLSIIMYWTGGDHVPLFVFYLWVTLGNGFRYGIRYLYISFGVSLIGFSSAIFWSSYWQQNQSFAISLLIILMILPVYAGVLLKKLHAAIDSAKQANEAKSRFLANMSHELRTPLNGVIGMGDLLRETKLSIEQRELVSTLHSSANSLLELIENVLDIAKIEAGKISIESKPLDLHALVNSVIFMLSPMGNSKGLTVSCTIDPDTPFSLEGDHQHLRQVLINLVNNAIKFTDEGSVNLHVYRKGGPETKPRIRFDIVDTGIGMPPESLDTIFDNFTQAEKKSTRTFAGTGLGTAISKELVELMGGKIGVESELDKGSLFWVEIPFKSIPHNDSVISSNRLVLLAGEDTAAAIRPALKGWDIEFDWVRSSPRALSLLIQAAEQGNHYHSVIVDQATMTDINPEQFAQMVKSENLLENLSLILVNSSDTMIDINSINHYYISTIVEPEDRRSLFNAIHAAQSVKVTDSNVVTMAEHYSRQAGANILNILVAEDNVINQKVIQGILRHAGHNVRIVETGEMALDVLSTDLDKIDMLILDKNMPERSGIEVVKSLRFMDTTLSMPVIMLTADATPEAREECINAGANAYLTKPINVKELLEKIAVLSRNIHRESASNNRHKAAAGNLLANDYPDSPWFNETILHELSLLGDEPNFIKGLVENFIGDGTRHIERINDAASHDYLEFREALHALKGSSVELGANKLVDICLKCEALKPYDIGTDRIQSMVSEITRVFNLTAEALSTAVADSSKFNPGGSE
ncbi:MAG: ATP-binding protein [Gammaproteobacteria bacterium]|nr:ATP-binding protein [Gammaproteobacteria bacterium]